MSTQQRIAELNQQIEQLYQQSQYEQAIPPAKEVVSLIKQLAGDTHPAYAAGLAQLAKISHAAGQDDQARVLLLSARQLKQNTLGENHLEVAEIGHLLGLVFLSLGDLPDAAKALTHALDIRKNALLADDPRLAESLDAQARLYLRQGLYKEAEPLFKQAQTSHEQHFGPDSAENATSLHNKAMFERITGDYGKAKKLAETALKIRRAVYQNGNTAIAETLDQLGEIHQAMGDYQTAETNYTEALNLFEQRVGKQHRDYTETLTHQAIFYQTIGRYEDAEQHLTQIVGGYRQQIGKEHPKYIAAVRQLGTLYREMGRYDEARSLLLDIQQVQQKLGQQNHPNFATTLDGLALTFQALGTFHHAQSRFEQALEIRQDQFGSDHVETATSLDHLAQFFLTTGHYDEARSRYETALHVKQNNLNPNHPAIADSLHNLAELFFLIGDDTQAQSRFEEALVIKETALVEMHPSLAHTQHKVANLYTELKQFEKAEANYQKAIEIRRAVLGEDHPLLVQTLSDFSALRQQQGQYEQARELAIEALQINEKSLSREHPDFVRSIHNLATIYHAEGNYDEARPLYLRALDLGRKNLGAQHPDVAQILNDWAGLRIALGQTDQALDHMQEAAGIDNQMIGQVFSIGSERQRMAYVRRLTEAYNRYLSLISQGLAGSPEATQAGANLVIQRKALGIEALAVQRDAILSKQAPELQEQLANLRQLQSQIAHSTLSGPDANEPVDVYQTRLNNWEAEKEQLEAQLADRIPEMNLAKQLQTADCSTVSSLLPENSLLLEFVRFTPFDFNVIPAQGQDGWQPARYLLFVLPAKQPDDTQMIDLGEAETVEKLITSFRETITGESEKRGVEATRLARRKRREGVAKPNSGADLVKLLLKPIQPMLQPNQHLYIANDGDLARLPFEILPLDGEKRLIDEHPISYLSVGRDVLRFQIQPTTKTSEPLVIADPDFDLKLDETISSDPDVSYYFGRLVGTRKEGEKIGTLLNVSPHFAEQALDQTIQNHPSPKILHIATHGFFLTPPNKSEKALPRDRLDRLAQQKDKPLLRSGLALAGINTWNQGDAIPKEAQDGVITGEDVSGLDLVGTELVVLSACETGLGQVEIGEGVFGLRRAFVLAGASTLVMSLWEVPDRETQILMEAFYSNILAGKPRSEALRQAQLQLKEDRPNPFYWGAFICQGNPREIRD